MNPPVRRQVAPRRSTKSPTPPKWQEIRQGLSRVALGYVCLFALVLPGLFLVRPVPAGGASSGLFGLNAELVNTIGWVLAVAGTFLGSLLLLAGQWRCLSCAPPGHGTKLFALASLLCSLLAPLCLGAVYLLDGSANWDLLQRGPVSITELSQFRLTDLFQAASLALGLLGVLLFCGYLRGVARCHADEQRVRGIAYFVWFVFFLVGSTVGLFLHAHSSALAVSWAVLALAWGVSLLWHLVLILAGSRGIQRFLQRKKSRGALAAVRDQGPVALRVSSLLQRADSSLWTERG